jgi:hypothetical protein
MQRITDMVAVGDSSKQQIDTRIRLTQSNNQSSLLFSIKRMIEQEFLEQNIPFTEVEIIGRHSQGKIEYFTSKPSKETEIHEETHKWLYHINPIISEMYHKAFNESIANAMEDHHRVGNQFSLSRSWFAKCAKELLLKGATQYNKDYTYISPDAMIKFSKHNLTSVLYGFSRLQHYDLITDLLSLHNSNTKDIIKQGVLQLRPGSNKRAISFLKQHAFLENDYLDMSIQCWSPKLFYHKNRSFFLGDESSSLTIFTTSSDVERVVAKQIYECKEKLEHTYNVLTPNNYNRRLAHHLNTRKSRKVIPVSVLTS